MSVSLHKPKGHLALDDPQRVSFFAPSGLNVELFEVLLDDVGGTPWARFRFLAPGISDAAQDVSFDAIQADFEYLCHGFALAYLQEYELSAEIIAISLLDQPVAFGEANPDAMQMIEVFRVEDSTCVWEGLW